jgi:glutathione S-transferase
MELGLSSRIDPVEIAVTPTKANPEFGRENPLMKVPALATDDGTVLYDSRVICEYLDALAGGGKLFPLSGNARWEALRRQSLGDGILDAGILRRYELVLRPEPMRWPEWLQGQQTKISQALDAAEREAGSWGEAFDIGHITIGCALDWLDFRFGEFAWRESRPRLAAWLARIAARPSMATTMPHA